MSGIHRSIQHPPLISGPASEYRSDRRITMTEQDRLPIAALLALAMTGFIAIMTETLPAGLLPQISGGLNVSQALAGQLVTLYAAGTLVAAIPLTAWTQGWPRKPTLLAAIIGLLVFNTVTALSSHYGLTLVARFLAGVSAGLAWVTLSGYARLMVTDRLKGKALAIALVGTPLALSLGVPTGSFLGAAVGWRVAFFAMSAATLILIGWVLWKVPAIAGKTPERRLSVGHVFMTPGLRPILATIFAWMAAHNILYTYIAPFAGRAGLESRVDLLLLGFGGSALVGIWLTAMMVDRRLRTLVLISLAVFSTVTLALGLIGSDPRVLIVGVALWGVSFGGAATLLQTAAADAVGEGMDLATAMIATTWNTAIAAGGIFGGILLNHWGAGTFPWAMLPLILAGLAIAWSGKARGFTPGPRIKVGAGGSL
jgi:predicted MFS family arabinose efflux permease